MRIKFVNLVVSAALLLLNLQLPGCVGYKLGSSLPAGLKTIFVPTFANKTKEPLIEVEATNATIAEFQKDGTLRVVGEEEADLVLDCTLDSVTLAPLRYDQSDGSKPTEYRLTLNATFVLKRTQVREKLGEASVIGEATFFFAGNLASAKRNALPAASEDLAKRIVEKVVEVW